MVFVHQWQDFLVCVSVCVGVSVCVCQLWLTVLKGYHFGHIMMMFILAAAVRNISNYILFMNTAFTAFIFLYKPITFNKLWFTVFTHNMHSNVLTTGVVFDIEYSNFLLFLCLFQLVFMCGFSCSDCGFSLGKSGGGVFLGLSMCTSDILGDNIIVQQCWMEPEDVLNYKLWTKPLCAELTNLCFYIYWLFLKDKSWWTYLKKINFNKIIFGYLYSMISPVTHLSFSNFRLCKKEYTLGFLGKKLFAWSLIFKNKDFYKYISLTIDSRSLL